MQKRLRARVIIGYVLACSLFLGLWPVGPAASVEGTWKRQTSGITNSLRAITILDANRGLAVGGDGIILGTSEGGTTWARQFACSDGGACNAQSANRITVLLHGASSLPVGDTYVVGQAIGPNGTILKQSGTNGTWSPQWVCHASETCNSQSPDLLNMENGAFRGVHFLSSNEAVAVGTKGTVAMTSDGIDWQSRVSGTSVSLNDVWLASSDVGWAVGDQGTILKTSTGGMTWVPQFVCQTSSNCTAQNKLTKNFYAVMFVSTTEGYIVGDDGTIVYTTNGGETWSLQTTNTTQHLNDIYVMGTNAVAGGTSGTLLGTSNSGGTWSPMYACSTSDPCNANSTDRLFHSVQSLALSAADVGTAVGGEGLILRLGSSSSPGPSPTGPGLWTVQATQVTSALRSTSFVNPSTGFTVGSDATILRTVDGGTTWTRLFACASGQASGAGCNLTSGDRFVAPLNGVTAISSIEAIAVGGDGFILKTTNNGTTWNRIVACRATAPNCNANSSSNDRVATSLEAIHGVSSSSLTAVGADGTILFSENGGQTWVNRPSITNSALRSVWFTSVDTGYAVGDNGTILKTTNEGQTWQPQFACAGTDNCVPQGSTHIRQRLNSVVFTNPTNGIIVGDGGTILTTTNGGDEWTVQTSGTQQNLYGVATAVNSGYTIGSSGTILVTTTNGTSWTPTFACRETNPCGAASGDRIFHTLNAISLPATNVATTVGQDGMVLRLAPVPQTPTPTPTPSISASTSGSPSPSVEPTSGSPSPTASASPSPPPKAQSFLTIKYRKKKRTFKGLIASDHEGCWQGRRIKVRRVKKGRDRTIGATSSTDSGKWSIRLNRKKAAKGRYYAVARRRETADIRCVRTRSVKVRV